MSAKFVHRTAFNHQFDARYEVSLVGKQERAVDDPISVEIRVAVMAGLCGDAASSGAAVVVQSPKRILRRQDPFGFRSFADAQSFAYAREVGVGRDHFTQE